MARNVTQKLISEHLVEGDMACGVEIALKVDQTLTQDATGTLVMLELEAMGLDRVRTELSVQYVDHNLLQADHRNPDDHVFLRSACRRFGIWFSGPGNGVSHPVHQERFGRPGCTLLGSDSHTPAAGAIGMFAIGAGGLDVAMAMAGHPFRTRMPEVWGVRLVGELPDWVSAKDVILEMLRRHGVAGGLGRVIEYHGPALAGLSAMDRHVIANMGAELGATTSVFPSDGEVRRFLASQGREQDWREILADPDAGFDVEEEIDLGSLEPLVALPSSPGHVVPLREIVGREIHQAYIGSSANPGYRDFAVAADIVRDRHVHPGVSLDLNPASRSTLQNLILDGHLLHLIQAGGRLHQIGCNGCIGMGQAPATGKLSLRTVPRNFPGRSGTHDDQVALVSPETAAASALAGVVTDPRSLDRPAPRFVDPGRGAGDDRLFEEPLDAAEAETVVLEKGPNIVSLPELERLPDRLELPVLLEVGDDVSTDEILPAGQRTLPYRSNIPRISEFVFCDVDPEYAARARQHEQGHCIVGGTNYGQGSSREHAALAPRHLGLRMVVARSFARIHRQNLVNFGILPVTLEDEAARKEIRKDDVLVLEDLQASFGRDAPVEILVERSGTRLRGVHGLTERQCEIVRQGGLTNWVRNQL